MYATTTALCWLGLVTAIAGHDQIPIMGKHPKRYNVTLDFDNLSTNKSGIGFHPLDPSAASFAYKDFFLDSFTVKNVAKAMPDLDTPLDILCASSAPNAIFGKRIPGYPWPHVSLHDLTLPRDHPRENVTFNMRSVVISPTGDVPGEIGKALVTVQIVLLKLPPDTPEPGLPPSAQWPGLVRGQPGFTPGRHIYQVGYIWGPGAHPSVKVDFEGIKKYNPGFGEGVDVMEVYAQVLRYKEGPPVRWETDSDWEFCIDDVSVEVVEGEHNEDRAFQEDLPARLTFLHSHDDVFVLNQELGEELKDLGM